MYAFSFEYKIKISSASVILWVIILKFINLYPLIECRLSIELN